MLSTLLLSMVLGSGQNQTAPPASQSEGPVVITTGEGVVKQAPDRLWVSIAAESRSKTPKEAQRANADAMKTVLDRLKGLGLPDDAIRTTGYDLQPEFDFANGKQTLRGWLARNSIDVRVDEIARAGDVLDSAVASGATNVSGVRFDLKDRNSAEREALRSAVADARRRADSAAAGAGMKVDRVLRIEEHRGMSPEPRPMMMARQSMMADSAGAPPIVAGEIEVRVSVTLTSTIK
jgi:uncharacterized protein YggE